MGLDVYANLIVGVRVKYADLFEPCGTVCKCSRGHEVPDTFKFCSICGARVESRQDHIARPVFAEYAKSLGASAGDLWRGDCESGVPAVRCVDQVENCEGDKLHNFAFGVRLARTGSHDGSSKTPQAVPPVAVADAVAKVTTVARRIGLTGDAEIFVNLYASY